MVWKVVMSTTLAYFGYHIESWKGRSCNIWMAYYGASNSLK